MISRRKLFGGLFVMFAVSAAGVFYLRLPAPLPVSQIYAEGGIAIRGTDPVAYFTQSSALPGDPAITLEWSGAIWRFVSAENRAAFAADPTAFAPQYGGFCAWAVAAKGQLFSTQPQNWRIVGGRLYLNYDDRVQADWNADIPGFIAEGDRRWPEIMASVQ